MRPSTRWLGVLAAALATPVPGPTAPVPGPALVLRGEVRTADGKPAAGAVVWTARHTYGPLERQEATADAAGRYSLPVSPGTWYVWARRGTQGAGGTRDPMERVQVVAGKTVNPVNLWLEERGTLRGRLLEAETGKSIPGGRLFLDAGLVLTAGEDGRFELGGLARLGHEGFVVAQGRVRARVLFDTTARTDTELDVPVRKAGRIVGRVTDEAGKPIPGAYVGRSTSGSYFSTNGLYEPCGPDGRFEYPAPPDAPTRLSAYAPGYAEEERDGLTGPRPGDPPLELTFRLRPKPPADRPDPKAAGDDRRRTVSGVVRGPDGKPAAGVLVRWGYMPIVGAVEARTKEDGTYSLVVPEAADVLAVLPKDLLPQFRPVPAGGDKAVEVELAAGRTAGGRVEDDTGKPIAGVSVIPVVRSPDPRVGNPYWLREAEVRTGADGRFLVRGVPADARFDFLKSGLSDQRNQTLKLDAEDNRVVLEYGGAVRGRVVDRAGNPIRSFRVLVNFPRQRLPNDVTSGYFAGYSGIGVRFTAADGTFVLTGVGAGSVYRLTAIADGHGEAVVDRVTAVPLNRLDGAEPVELKAGPSVRFRVRATAAGKPLTDARVTLVNGQPGLDQHFTWGYDDASWEDMVRGRTAADGWAEFPALSFGEATVVVRALGYARHRVGWRNGQAELAADLSPEGVVVGEVVDAAGVPVDGYYVNMFVGGDQVSAFVRPGERGAFRMAELPAGTWTVMVRGRDGRSQLYHGQAAVKSGETTTLRITAKPE